MLKRVSVLWQNIRQLSGDDAYERYLKHYAEHQAVQENLEPPLSREAYFKQWQDSKWKGMRRCC
jgi:uncharacterized short protein YbdD (DUF466 family)